MPQYIKSGKLFLHDPARSRHEADIFLGSSDHDETTKLFIIVDFPRAKVDQSYLIDLVFKEVVDTFDASDETNPEVLLEQILESLNLALPEISPKKNREWLKQLNLLVGISDSGQLHFSNIGDIDALLLQDGRLSTISERQKNINPLKLFGNITSGVLNPGDVVLFTTNTLTDYISEVKIKHILKNFPPVEMSHKFEELLQEVPSFVTFTAVALKFTKDKTSGILPSRKKEVVEEVEEEEEYSPRKAKASKRSGRREKRARRRGGSIQLAWLRSGISFLASNAAYYFTLIWQILLYLVMAVIGAIKFVISRDYRKHKEQHLWDKIDSTVHTTHSNVKGTSKLNKILIGLTAVIVVVFINIIIFSGQERQVNNRLDSFNQGLVDISALQTEVDATRISGDDQQAETLLLQMQSLATTLTPTNPNQEDELATVNESILRQLTEVRKINYIENPLLFQDLSSVSSNVKDLNLLDNNLYFTTATKLYRINGEIEELVDLPDNTVKLIPNTDRGTLFVMTDDDILEISGDALRSVDLDTSDSLQKINEALIYSDNLYILDRNAGIIFRHTGASNGSSFRPGEIWLEDDNIASNASGFAIDGDIYVISDTGEIIKLFRGERQAFNYVKPNPPFGSGAKIYTRSESEFLYILDPQNQRVAILNKDGKIKDQYISSKFDNLSNLAIDSEESTIYLLNGDQVYLLAINK